MDEKEKMEDATNSASEPRKPRRNAIAIVAVIALAADIAAGSLHLSGNLTDSRVQPAPVEQMQDKNMATTVVPLRA